MGLTSIKNLTFYWVSQLAMLPATAVYVNAGTQLRKIKSLNEIFSKELLIAFTLIGLLPIFGKWIIKFRENRVKNLKYKKPRNFEFNLVVIGGGSAGLVSAYIASAVKAKVALIEKNKMGGDCLNTGCVPSKSLIATAKLLKQINSTNEHGIGLNKILNTIHIYPTYSEANKYVAGLWKKKSTSPRLLELLKLFHKWRL